MGVFLPFPSSSYSKPITMSCWRFLREILQSLYCSHMSPLCSSQERGRCRAHSEVPPWPLHPSPSRHSPATPRRQDPITRDPGRRMPSPSPVWMTRNEPCHLVHFRQNGFIKDPGVSRFPERARLSLNLTRTFRHHLAFSYVLVSKMKLSSFLPSPFFPLAFSPPACLKALS